MADGHYQYFFWCDMDHRFVICSLHGLYGALAHQSFFWYENDKDLKRLVFVAQGSNEGPSGSMTYWVISTNILDTTCSWIQSVLI